MVSFQEIVLTSLQGDKPWIDTSTITDSLATLTVNQIMRGPTSIAVKFLHPVHHAKIICNATDTVLAALNLDGYYRANLNLKIGANELQIVAASKNRTSTKKVLLKGIERRLARVDNSNPNLFRVSAPSTSRLGISVDYYLNVDSIKKMDPLIDHIVIARTSIYGTLVNPADSALKKLACDLGDGGNGKPITAAYQVMSGVSEPQREFTICNYLSVDAPSKTYADDSLKHAYDYAYFVYTAHEDIARGNYYITMPLPARGIYYVNDRTIVIDSVIRFIGCNQLWGGTQNWKVKVRATSIDPYIQATFSCDTSEKWVGMNDIALYVWTGAFEMSPGQNVNLAGKFSVDYFLGTWRHWTLPMTAMALQGGIVAIDNDCFTYNEIINQATRSTKCLHYNNGNSVIDVTMNYSDVSYNGFSRKCWNFPMDDGNYKNHTGGIWVHWRYKYNHRL